MSEPLPERVVCGHLAQGITILTLCIWFYQKKKKKKNLDMLYIGGQAAAECLKSLFDYSRNVAV